MINKFINLITMGVDGEKIHAFILNCDNSIINIFSSECELNIKLDSEIQKIHIQNKNLYLIVLEEKTAVFENEYRVLLENIKTYLAFYNKEIQLTINYLKNIRVIVINNIYKCNLKE